MTLMAGKDTSSSAYRIDVNVKTFSFYVEGTFLMTYFISAHALPVLNIEVEDSSKTLDTQYL